MKPRFIGTLIALALAIAVFGQTTGLPDALRIARSLAPGWQFSSPVAAARGNRAIWIVEAMKDGRVRTVTIDKQTGRVIGDSQRGAGRVRIPTTIPKPVLHRAHPRSIQDPFRRPTRRKIPAVTHTPKGHAYGYWEHHKQGTWKKKDRKHKSKGHGDSNGDIHSKEHHGHGDDNKHGGGRGHGG